LGSESGRALLLDPFLLEPDLDAKVDAQVPLLLDLLAQLKTFLLKEEFAQSQPLGVDTIK
jgi:hypothetical protein